jgi:hypothetical protein
MICKLGYEERTRRTALAIEWAQLGVYKAHRAGNKVVDQHLHGE